MRITVTSRDRRRSLISLIVLLIGLFFVGLSYTPWANPPQCGEEKMGETCIIGANIGGGLVWLLGMAIVIPAAAAFLSSIIFGVLAGKGVKTTRALLVTGTIVGLIVLACWYAIIGADTIRNYRYQKEIQKRQANFVEYKAAPDIHAVAEESTSLSVTPASGNAQSASLDLHGCSPGKAHVSYASGTDHLVFSGVRSGGPGNSECIFYIGREIAGQPWDGMLHAKCTWPISGTLANNQKIFAVTDKGVLFATPDSFLASCQDLRTGVVPDLY